MFRPCSGHTQPHLPAHHSPGRDGGYHEGEEMFCFSVLRHFPSQHRIFWKGETLSPWKGHGVSGTGFILECFGLDGLDKPHPEISHLEQGVREPHSSAVQGPRSHSPPSLKSNIPTCMFQISGSPTHPVRGPLCPDL